MITRRDCRIAVALRRDESFHAKNQTSFVGAEVERQLVRYLRSFIVHEDGQGQFYLAQEILGGFGGISVAAFGKTQIKNSALG